MNRLHSPARDILQWAVGVVCLALLTRTWILMGLIVPVTVDGTSMEPTLHLGDQVVVDRTAYLFHQPQPGDVVVFRCPQKASELCIKRIVGLPGQRIALQDGQMLADGQPVRTPSRYAVRYEDRAAFQSRTGDTTDAPNYGDLVYWDLEPGEYFVVGDNAEVSDDSRSWWHKPGLEERHLVGRAIGVP